jgi:hypothetical protein
MKTLDSFPPAVRGICRPLRLFALLILNALGLLASTQVIAAADFSVTSPGFFYSITGQSGQNPTLNLVRGQTYTFSINTSPIHPFKILSKGVQNNNINSGTITFTVPDVASNYQYICSVHFFGGTIKTIPANTTSPPPVVQIVGVSVTTNIVLTSTGTNGWGVFPEFVTDVASTNWSALSVETNRFANGTNETICGRPPAADTVFIRIRSQAN